MTAMGAARVMAAVTVMGAVAAEEVAAMESLQRCAADQAHGIRSRHRRDLHDSARLDSVRAAD